MTTRKTLFDWMDLGAREEYLAHRIDFEKNVNQWKLDTRSRRLLMQAKEIAWDTETIAKPPPGTYKHLTNGVRDSLGLTYLTDVTHVSFYAVVDDEEVLVVMVAPFTEDELEFVRELFARTDCLFVTHNGVFDYRIFCGHHDVPLPEHTYCTMVGQTVMFGGPKGGYPGRYNRSLESLIKLYDLMPKVVDVAWDVADEWFTGQKNMATLLLSQMTFKEAVKASDLSEKALKKLQAGSPLSDEEIVSEWLAYMKKKRDVLHTLPARYVAVYVMVDSICTLWAYYSQMRWCKVLHEGSWKPDAPRYEAVWERMQETQRYQNVLNYWAIRGVNVNREWVQQQLEKIEEQKKRWIPYFLKRGCGDLTKADQKERFIFEICHSPRPDPWEYVEFSNGGGKWYPAEMQNKLWTKSGIENLTRDGWQEGENYSQWHSTSGDAVQYYLKFGPEEHRSKLKLYDWYTSMLSQESTYREWLDHSSYDGRVHSQASATANTLRTITSTPNQQNLNMHAPKMIDVYDPETGGLTKVEEFTSRGIIAPDEGKVLEEYDLSGAEVRFAAIRSRAKGLVTAFNRGDDLHKFNAAAFNNIPVEEVTKELRNGGKGVFFSKEYGAGARSVASNPNVLRPVAEVGTMIDNWNRNNPEVVSAKEHYEQQAKIMYYQMSDFPLVVGQQAYTVLFNGQRVPAPVYNGKPKYYTVWNSQQQGGVGGIAMPAIIAAHEYLKQHPELKSDLLLMVHDSIVLQVPEDDEEAARQAGEYVAMQLMTQIPLELTVIDGIEVPWPSGCVLYENQYKWGWRPDKEFPYECGPNEDESVVITFPVEDAWEVMKQQSLTRQKQKIDQLLRSIKAHYRQPMPECIPWYKDGVLDPCLKWKSAVKYSLSDHYEQSRFWSDFLRLHHHEIADEMKQTIIQYRAWVRETEGLDTQLQELRAAYEQTKEFRAATT